MGGVPVVEKLMVIILLLFTVGIPSSGRSQVIVVDDDFNDADLTTGTVWSGDTADFTTVNEAGNYRLRLNAPAAGTSRLVTSSAAAFGSWEFFVHFDFSTLSGSNNLTVYLTSDRSDLEGEVNGYALRAGEAGGDDLFELVRYDRGSASETILRGRTNINNGGAYQVKVDRTPGGRWTLAVARGYGSEPVEEATGLDNTHTASSYFGFQPSYTSTRADAFYFDDLVITKSP
ncbi:MAG: hypothetical protein R3224_08250, partial [Balneolaceae bacterium]|nr:hypothetical protein [Balneolaceae bacterium]